MKNVVIVYYSQSGYTRLVGEAIAEGLKAAGTAKVELLEILGSDIKEGRYVNESVLQKVQAADGVIFGTPTFMGGPAAQFKAFADASGGAWYHRAWAGKLAGAFTTSSSPSGDKFSTLQYLNTYANQHGMIWVGQNELPAGARGNVDGVNRLGSHLGVMGQNTNAPGATPVVDAGDAATARIYGERFAKILAKF